MTRAGGTLATWLFAGLIFLGGAGVGAGAAGVWFGQRMEREPPEPAELAERLSAELAEEYDLAPTQRERARNIIERRQERMHRAHEKLRAELGPEFDELDAEMAEVLGPEKAKRWKQRFERARRHHGKRRPRGESRPEPDGLP